jgi:opacity protein-like surface antigen
MPADLRTAPGYQPYGVPCPPGTEGGALMQPDWPQAGEGTGPHAGIRFHGGLDQNLIAAEDSGSFDPAGMPEMWETSGVAGLSRVCSPLFYVDLFAGTHGWDHSTGSSANLLAGTTTLQFEDGFSFGTRLGLFQGNNLRTDFEFSLTDNDVTIQRQFNIAPVPGMSVAPTSSGDLSVFQGASNAWWDLNALSWGRLTPYVGAGIGFLSAHADWTQFEPTANHRILDRDSSALFQAMVGGTWRCTSRLELFAEYRAVECDALTLSTETTVNVEAGGLRSQLRDDQFDLSGDSVRFGLRMKF